MLLVAATHLTATGQATAPVDGFPDLDSDDGGRTVDVAYGRQTYNEVTGSIGTIYNDKIKQGFSTSLAQSLQGKLPGVTAIQNSFQPSSVPTIYLRGTNTYNSGTPLVIVDGFRSDYTKLSVYEVESISVLKDASAVVLYGQEAANGVILVTTKRGRKGPTRISFDGEYGMQTFANLPNMLSSTEYANYYNQALANDGLAPKFTDIYDANGNSYYGQGGIYRYTHPDNNFVKELTRSWAPIARGGINIDGGGEAVRYMVTAAYLHNGGLLNRTKENSYSTQTFTNRYNLRANLDIRISRNITALIDMGGSIEKRNNPGKGVLEILSTMYWTPPTEYPLVNPGGSLGGTSDYRTNPYGSIAQKGYMTDLFRTLDLKLGLRYDLGDFVKGLSIGAKGMFYNYQIQSDNKTRSFAVYEIASLPASGSLDDATYTSYDSDSDLVHSTDVSSEQRKNFEADVDFKRTFGLHSLNVMAMFHMDRYETSANYHYLFSNAGVGFRAHYGYDNRFFAEFAASYYGQEQYAKGHRFGFFPAGAVAWVASNEEFLKQSSWVDYLKIRASYGKVGGQAFGGNSVAARMYHSEYYTTSGTTVIGSEGQYGAAGRHEGPYANRNITWDKSYKTDISLEATLWNHISLMFDWYHDVRKDILTSTGTSLPGTLGYRSGYINGGEVKNRGYEATLGYFGTAGDFGYNITAGIWHNKNKVIKRPDVTVYQWDYANQIGKRTGQVFGYVAEGFYTVADLVDMTVTPTFGNVQEGDVKYRDMNGDGIIDENDKAAVGYSSIPEYTYSFSLDLKYRNWSLSILGQGTAKGSVMLGGNHMPLYARENAIRQLTEKSWTRETASTARYPRLSTLSNLNNSQASTIWLMSTDYFKIRNIEIGYQLPEKLMRRINFGMMKVYVSGNNLFTHAKEIDFMDPESITMQYPALRSVSLGVKLSF